MLYILTSFKKEISYLLDIVNIKNKRRINKKIYYRCSINNKDFYIVKSGLGRKSIELSDEQFKDCDLLLSVGFCGALVKDLKNGDIVISNQIVAIDKDDYNSIIYSKDVDESNLRIELIEYDKRLVDRFIVELGKDNLTVRVVKGFTSPKVVRNKSQKIAINRVTDAEVVDMEDMYRLEFAKRIGANFLSIRTVLDEITDDIPGFADGFKMGQKLSGIISKMDRAAQGIAIAVEKFVRLL